ncbi:MAG: SMI1/KNR4 family protein [Polyangiales bacterium]
MPWTVEAEHIDAAEAKLGATFPKSYRRHIGAANGGSLSLLDDEWHVLPIWDTSTTKRASRTSNDVVRETLRLRELHWFPEGGVAIALLNTDALVLLSAEGRIEDRCFVWYSGGDGLETIADSCDALFTQGREAR